MAVRPGAKKYSPPRVTTKGGRFCSLRRIGRWGIVKLLDPSFGPTRGSFSEWGPDPPLPPDAVRIAGLIIGENYDCAPGTGPRVLRHVARGVQEPPRDVRATLECLLVEYSAEFRLGVLTAAAEGKAHARRAVEDHNADPILIAEGTECLM